VPSEWHDAFVRLIREKPQLAVKVLREIMGVDLPAEAPAWLGPEVFNERPSSDLITDNTIVIGPGYAPLRVIIVEVQAEQSDSKRRQIPRYAMAAWLWHECPVDVLVLCPDEKTAAWYTEPLPTALDDCLYRPKGLLPSSVPAVRDVEAMAADPVMGLLSVIYHGQDRAVAEAFVEGVTSLGPEQGNEYYEHASVLSPQPVRDILEVIVTTTQASRYSAIARRHYADGLAEGKAEARVEDERHTIRMVLRARGLSMTAGQAAQLDACNDLTMLRGWSQAALSAEDAGDIFR
jgi:hypothetical protein